MNAPWKLLITCEHASGALPAGEDLGLTPEQMASHISMDAGAAELATALGRGAKVPVHLGRLSRLWVDLNRRETNPDVIVQESSGVTIPGNVDLDAEARIARIRSAHLPYREAVRTDALLLVRQARCLHLSIHSFNPELDPGARAFDVGILFDPHRHPEAPIAEELRDAMAARGYAARLNEPYRGTPEGLTSHLRDQLDQDRYIGLEIEASQAAIATPEARAAMALALEEAVAEVL